MTKILNIDNLSAETIAADQLIIQDLPLEDVIDVEVDERFDERVVPVQEQYDTIIQQNNEISAMIIEATERLENL